jgi:hypothetical protein
MSESSPTDTLRAIVEGRKCVHCGGNLVMFDCGDDACDKCYTVVPGTSEPDWKHKAKALAQTLLAVLERCSIEISYGKGEPPIGIAKSEIRDLITTKLKEAGGL